MRVKINPHRLDVTFVVPVRGIEEIAARIAGFRLDDSFQMFEIAFDTPEAPAREHRLGSRLGEARAWDDRRNNQY